MILILFTWRGQPTCGTGWHYASSELLQAPGRATPSSWHRGPWRGFDSATCATASSWPRCAHPRHSGLVVPLDTCLCVIREGYTQRELNGPTSLVTSTVIQLPMTQNNSYGRTQNNTSIFHHPQRPISWRTIYLKVLCVLTQGDGGGALSNVLKFDFIHTVTSSS